jgi:hypothetical protein
MSSFEPAAAHGGVSARYQTPCHMRVWQNILKNQLGKGWRKKWAAHGCPTKRRCGRENCLDRVQICSASLSVARPWLFFVLNILLSKN